MLDRAAILQALAERRAELQSRGVRSLAVFGSVARGDYRSGSDLDLLVEFDPAAHVTLFDVMRLQDALEGLTGRKVQIASRAALRPYAREEIAREMVDVF
jgi:uncharacterized protein